MSKAVTSRARRVVRPPATQERIRLPRLAWIASICFSAGLAAVVWNAGGRRLEPPPAALEPPNHGHAAAPAPEASADAGVAPAFVIAEGDAAAALTVTVDELDAGSTVPTATSFSGPRRLEPGRVAYLRCEGPHQGPGAYPCPRDQALEAAVWAILDTLPRCADAPPGLGESDVRLEVAAGAPTDIKLRAPRAGLPRLDGPAILRCAAGPLSHIATTTDATKLVLAFRFELVDASQPRVTPLPTERRGTP